MDAISHVQTVTQIGWLKMGGGVALYLGRIREMDRQRLAAQRQQQRTARREDFERL